MMFCAATPRLVRWTYDSIAKPPRNRKIVQRTFTRHLRECAGRQPRSFEPGRIVGRGAQDPGRARLAEDRDRQRVGRLAPCGVDVGERKALPHVVTVGPGGDVADAPAVVMDRLVARGVGVG